MWKMLGRGKKKKAVVAIARSKLRASKPQRAHKMFTHPSLGVVELLEVGGIAN